ncbi:MAG TPA: flagellar hook-length control protein FliK [Gammaproteobacteria bacterium]|nr:flagellar hook-length control protein FliK [Gammaproteobacteria bacterium]
MDAAVAPPPDLLTVAAPLSRGPPGAARPPGQRDPGGSPTVAAFDLLLQMLGTGLPAGQSLPVSGSGLPGGADAADSATAPGACAGVAAPANGQTATGAQSASTTLSDWLRLALAGASGDTAAPAATGASADGSTAPSTAPTDPTAPPPTLASASASADQAPIDLQALLGANADTQAPVQPLAALVNAAREQITGTDSQRRAQTSVTPADGSTQTASDLKPTDPTALQAPGAPVLPAVTQIPAAVAKTAHLDDSALPLAVTPTTGTDAASAPPLALVHASGGTHATDASAASAQAALPQSSGDAIDTNAARWHDALASRIQWLVDHDVGEAKIKLNPPELGALDVKIALQDDKTYVQMTAHSASARDELAQGLPRLRELLSAGGLELGGATVSGGHDDRGAFGSSGPQPITRVAAFASTADDVQPDLPRARLGAGSAVIDTFA